MTQSRSWSIITSPESLVGPLEQSAAVVDASMAPLKLTSMWRATLALSVTVNRYAAADGYINTTWWTQTQGGWLACIHYSGEPSLVYTTNVYCFARINGAVLVWDIQDQDACCECFTMIVMTKIMMRHSNDDTNTVCCIMKLMLCILCSKWMLNEKVNFLSSNTNFGYIK